VAFPDLAASTRQADGGPLRLGNSLTHAGLVFDPPVADPRRGLRRRVDRHVDDPRATPSPEKLAPYECGMPAVSDARERHPIQFYLVAMIFLLFDIEVAFLYPWAMALRDLSWPGLVQILVFFAILIAGYAYVWKKGALTWDRP
jgi:NADH-quinone oxidoreductase subunit A